MNWVVICKTILGALYCLGAFLLVSGTRLSKKNTIISVTLFTVIGAACNILLYSLVTNIKFEHFFLLSFFLPASIFSFFVCERRGLSQVSAILNIYLIFHMMILCIYILNKIFGDSVLANFLVYLVGMPLGILYLRLFVRKIITFIDHHMKTLNWLLIFYNVLVLLEFFIYGFIVYKANRLTNTTQVIGASIFSVYLLSLLFIYDFLKIYNKKENELAVMRINDEHLKSFMTMSKQHEAHEKQLRILRHDLKHMLVTFSGLIKSGENEKALDLLKSYDIKIEESKSPRFCTDPLINNVLQYYNDKCAENNIKFDAVTNHIENNLNIPSEELIIIISNCLDNAINATMKLEKDRYIEFTLINNDNRFILKEENNFNGDIKFDEKQLPTNLESFHGYGTKSINYFAKQYGLDLSYDIKDNIFKIYILFD